MGRITKELIDTQMKKVLLFATVGAILVAGACNKMPDQTSAQKLTRVSAIMEGYQTKASLDENTMTVKWQEGDLIKVVIYNPDKQDYNPWVSDFILESGAGETKGTFKINGGGSYTSAEKLNALYPVFDSNYGNQGTSTSQVYIHLQESYSYSAGTYFPPMVSYQSQDISFKHVAGAVKVTLNNIPAVIADKVSMTMDQDITGWFTYDLPYAGTTGIETPNSGTGGKTVSFTDIKSNSVSNKVFYFPVPKVTTPKITLTLYSGDDVLLTKTASNQASIGRAQLLEMKPIDISMNTEESSSLVIRGDAVADDWNHPIPFNKVKIGGVDTKWVVANSVSFKNSGAFKFVDSSSDLWYGTASGTIETEADFINVGGIDTKVSAAGEYDVYLNTGTLNTGTLKAVFIKK